jgi:hypothetical protein
MMTDEVINTQTQVHRFLTTAAVTVIIMSVFRNHE